MPLVFVRGGRTVLICGGVINRQTATELEDALAAPHHIHTNKKFDGDKR